ncbi:hypothetical protein AB0L25_38820 [Spirillospora sp. NPDC052242]
MAIRPTEHWRRSVAVEARQIASGELAVQCAFWAEFFPEAMLIRTDEVLWLFEREIATLTNPADDEIFAAIERVVLALNKG